MLMPLIACISRGCCFSLSICPWRETQELFPICPPPPLLLLLVLLHLFWPFPLLICHNPNSPVDALVHLFSACLPARPRGQELGLFTAGPGTN